MDLDDVGRFEEARRAAVAARDEAICLAVAAGRSVSSVARAAGFSSLVQVHRIVARGGPVWTCAWCAEVGCDPAGVGVEAAHRARSPKCTGRPVTRG